MDIQATLNLIKKLPEKSAPYIIAIDGFGGSGKSTTARKLSEHLQNSTIVSMDDFINKDHFYDASWEEAFNREQVRSKVTSLSSTTKGYIIVEGISSMHPSLANLYDFTVWVDTPIDVAKNRGQLRDAGNENEDKWELWAENDLKYSNEYGPREHADSIIINSNDSSI